MTALGPVGRADMVQTDLWGLMVPERRTGAQEGIGWTPSEREMSQVVQKRESKSDQILALFREKGSLTTLELQQITGRFSARLGDLKRRGFRYDRQDFKAAGNEHSVYRMTQEPKGE